MSDPSVTREAVIEFLSRLSPPGLHELILALEDRLGIERAYTPPLRVVMGAPIDPWSEPEARFVITLVDAGELRVAVIRALRELRELSGLRLAEVRALVEGAPSILADDVEEERVEAYEAALKGLGVTLEVKRR
ncbi:MAG: ribosomal protein L7/L12 [Nannocystaceae bacterium]